MGKTRVWTLGLAAVLAIAATGCTHLVHHEDLEGMMDPVNARLSEHDGQISALQSDVSGIQSDVDALQSALDQLRQDFGAHVSDEDLHCPCGLAISLPVHFDFDSSELRDVDRPLLDAFAAAVTGNFPNANITVEGSADQAGDPAYNMRLSQERAENVRGYLVDSAGLSGDNVRVVALGESRLVSEETGVTNPQSGIENRRVTFVLEWAGPGTSN